MKFSLTGGFVDSLSGCYCVDVVLAMISVGGWSFIVSILLGGRLARFAIVTFRSWVRSNRVLFRRLFGSFIKICLRIFPRGWAKRSLGKIIEISCFWDLSDGEIKKVALEEQKIKEMTHGKTVKKIIVVKGKLVNIVISDWKYWKQDRKYWLRIFINDDYY